MENNKKEIVLEQLIRLNDLYELFVFLCYKKHNVVIEILNHKYKYKNYSEEIIMNDYIKKFFNSEYNYILTKTEIDLTESYMKIHFIKNDQLQQKYEDMLSDHMGENIFKMCLIKDRKIKLNQTKCTDSDKKRIKKIMKILQLLNENNNEKTQQFINRLNELKKNHLNEFLKNTDMKMFYSSLSDIIHQICYVKHVMKMKNKFKILISFYEDLIQIV